MTSTLRYNVLARGSVSGGPNIDGDTDDLNLTDLLRSFRFVSVHRNATLTRAASNQDEKISATALST